MIYMNIISGTMKDIAIKKQEIMKTGDCQTVRTQIVIMFVGAATVTCCCIFCAESLSLSHSLTLTLSLSLSSSYIGEFTTYKRIWPVSNFSRDHVARVTILDGTIGTAGPHRRNEEPPSTFQYTYTEQLKKHDTFCFTLKLILGADVSNSVLYIA